MTKLTHLMELLITLQYKELTTASELSQILNVNKKTVYRYIETLIEANIPIMTKKGRYGGFYLDSSFFMKQPKLEKDEVEALIMATDVLSADNMFIFQKQLRNAVSKIKATAVNENSKFRDFKEIYEFEVKKVGRIEEFDDKMAKINMSMSKSRVMEVNYFSINKNSSNKFKIEPYTIMYRNGEWFIVGFSSAMNDIGVFAVSRIKKVKLIDEIFIKPADFVVGNYLENQWEQIETCKTKVVIKFSSNVAEFIKDTKWHPNQKSYSDIDGNIIFEIYVNEYEELKKWILGFGCNAEVVEPIELRKNIKEEAQAIIRYYNKDIV